jgi:hypothetical protein
MSVIADLSVQTESSASRRLHSFFIKEKVCLGKLRTAAPPKQNLPTETFVSIHSSSSQLCTFASRLQRNRSIDGSSRRRPDLP